MKFSSMSKLESAEMFAKTKHASMTRKDGITPYFTHLESVVSYLKSLGVTDEDVLCSGWLHDTIEDTDTTFDELYERFGKKVAVLVSTLSKDKKLPKKERERLYVNQKKKTINQILHYLKVIKNDITENKSNYPKISNIIKGINDVLVKNGQKPVII